ncbi:hypothetical protein BDQ94DRAFT_161104 [Aspergillus welwitschiae]|uniref:Uncharacterized protein n=1 Tax=Aspergillus welwitschiae TaxID=1341132 RepID=A0A3F3PVH3_9EURO|nr:hypothetical protein BDQ94DRAFT_161104 [Aspergillus welwitschiae]RDH30924.1 hypothetical protein BDQ94DRAFT_161104 [Aspergillus welwitschiae]
MNNCFLLEAVAQLGLSTVPRASSLHTWVPCPARRMTDTLGTRGRLCAADSAPDMRPPMAQKCPFILRVMQRRIPYTFNSLAFNGNIFELHH